MPHCRHTRHKPTRREGRGDAIDICNEMNGGALAEAEVLVEGRMKEGKSGRVGDWKREEGKADDRSISPSSHLDGSRFPADQVCSDVGEKDGHMVRHGQTWSDMVNHGQTWSDMVRDGQARSDMFTNSCM